MIAAAQIHTQIRNAGLVDEGLERRHDLRMMGDIGDGLDELLGRRIAAREFVEIDLDALLPFGRADIVLEHGEHGGALVIGDAVEDVGDVARPLDRIVDAPRRGQLVDRHHGQAVIESSRARIRPWA